MSQMADRQRRSLAPFLVFRMRSSSPLPADAVTLMIRHARKFALRGDRRKVGPRSRCESQPHLFRPLYLDGRGRWTEELLARLETDRTVFETMAHDMYQNGQVLAGKKYRFLALAYKVFMIGLFVTLNSRIRFRNDGRLG